MNCEKFAEMLDNYSDLSDNDVQELEAHAGICRACSDELSFMRSIMATAGSLPPIEPPSDFLDKVNSRLDEELASETPIDRFVRRSRPYVSRYGAIAACVAVAAALSTNAGIMLTRMHDDGSGVISEQKTTADSTAAGTVSPSAQTAPDTGEAELSAPEGAAEAPAVSQPDMTAAAIQPIPSQVPIKQDSTTGTVSAPKPAAATPVPNRRSVSVTGVPAATPQPLATANTGIVSAPPAQSLPETVPDVPASFDNEPAAVTAQPAAAEKNDESYNIAANDIASSGGYAALSEAETADGAESPVPDTDSSEYMLASIGSEQASTYASLSSTVSVKAKDINRVKELVDVFVNGVYGNYYMITAQDMNGLLGQFDREGIWYNANIMESGDKISFKLITMQID